MENKTGDKNQQKKANEQQNRSYTGGKQHGGGFQGFRRNTEEKEE